MLQIIIIGFLIGVGVGVVILGFVVAFMLRGSRG